MAKKCTKAEAQKRTRIVLEMLLQSTPPVDIVQFGIANWDITEGGVWKYITAAYDLMKEMAKSEREEVYAANLAQRRYLKNKAIKAEDYRLAHEVVKDEAKLLDLYPSEKQEVEHKGDVVIKVIYETSNGTSTDAA
jgi:hypothetical protein